MTEYLSAALAKRIEQAGERLKYPGVGDSQWTLDILRHLADEAGAAQEHIRRLEAGRTIPARRSDPTTSHEATENIKIDAKSQRGRLLKAFAGYDGYGATDEQAMEASVEVSPLSEYAKRCSELREAGFIQSTEERRKGISGQDRMVSRITSLGLEVLESL